MIKSLKKRASKKHHHHNNHHANYEEFDKFCKMNETERYAEYLRLATEGWQHAWDIYHDSGWKLSSGKDLETGCVHTKHDDDGRKIFKLDGLIDAKPVEVFNQLVHGDNESPAWNPTVLMCKTVEKLNDHTDIAYNISSPGAGGLVSSRDFVNLRHWKTKEDLTLSLGLSTAHPDMPPTKQYVRAENKPAAWVFKPMAGGEKCHFTLILKTDLKGWLPHYLVDQAMTGCLVNYIKYLRDRMHDIKHNNAINTTTTNTTNNTTKCSKPTSDSAQNTENITKLNGISQNMTDACKQENVAKLNGISHDVVHDFKPGEIEGGLSRSSSESSFQSCEEEEGHSDLKDKLEELDLNGKQSFVLR